MHVCACVAVVLRCFVLVFSINRCILDFAMSSIAALRLLCCSSQISIHQEVDAIARAVNRADYAATCVEIITAMGAETDEECVSAVMHVYWCRAVWQSYPKKYKLHLSVMLSAPLLPEDVACPLAGMRPRRAAGHESSTCDHELFRLVALQRTLKLLECEMANIYFSADSDAVDADCDLMEFVSVLR